MIKPDSPADVALQICAGAGLVGGLYAATNATGPAQVFGVALALVGSGCLSLLIASFLDGRTR